MVLGIDEDTVDDVDDAVGEEDVGPDNSSLPEEDSEAGADMVDDKKSEEEVRYSSISRYPLNV